MLQQRGTPNHDGRQRPTLRRATTVIGILAVTLLGGPCDGGGATASSSSTIAAVSFDPGPDSARVDVVEPARSRPTSTTPENVPGLVLEEVTVKSVNETVAGPAVPPKERCSSKSAS